MKKYDKKVRWLQLTLGTIIIGSYCLVFPDIKHGWHLTYEDGIIENIGAIAFLFTSILFFNFFFLSRKNEIKYLLFLSRGNVIYLGLGLLFFFAFGEEISWGQRVFGLQTPEGLRAMNLQQEINIHNLEIFNQQDKLKEEYGFLATIFSFSPGRIFFYFWFSFLVLIPLLSHYSGRWQKRLKSLYFPIAPWWIGSMMIAAFVLSKIFNIFAQSYYESNYNTVDEFMEMDYALIFAGLTLYWRWSQVYLDKHAN